MMEFISDVNRVDMENLVRYIEERGSCDVLVNMPTISLEVLETFVTCTYQVELTPLMLAAERGLPEVIDALVSRGVALDREDSRGRTALIYAAENGRTSAVHALISNGANCREVSWPNGPLLIPVYQGETEIVRLLLDAGARHSDDTGGASFLFYIACKNTTSDIPTLLLNQFDVDVDYQTVNGFNPLLMAIMHSNETTELLISHGVNVNAVGPGGKTMLELARLGNNQEAVKLLLNAGALEVDSAEAMAVYRPHYRNRILINGTMEAGEADEKTISDLDSIMDLVKLREVLVTFGEKHDPGRSWQEILA